MPLLAAFGLLEGKANVLDFGGGLGMVYFELARILADRINSWTVTELPEISSYGNQHLADGRLTFTDKEPVDQPDFVIASHVVQYLAKPYDALSKLANLNPKIIVLHELPLSTKGPQFGIQSLLAELGGGIRPVQFLVSDTIQSAMPDFTLLAEIDLPRWAPDVIDTKHVAQLYLRKHD
jgi:putative methyltransferase (TIGR04325 family)